MPNPTRRRLRTGLALLAVAAAAAAPAARAMSFTEAFDAALANDAQFRAAGHERNSAQLGVPIARAGLLPQLSYSYSNSAVTGRRTFPNAANQEVRVGVDYTTPQSALTLSTPVFNYEAWQRLRQAEALAQAADSTFRQRGLDLVDRLGRAYVDVLMAEESLALSEAQVVSIRGQLQRAEQRFARGEGTRTEVAIAQATLDVSNVRVFESRDQIDVARAALRRVIGRDAPPLQRTAADFSPPDLQPAGLDEWVAIALRQSPTVRAREFELEAARRVVERQRAGHMPRVDVIARLSRNQNESLSSLNQGSELKSLGVQVVVPLFSGFGVVSSVDQAQSEVARQEELLRNERENVQLEVQRWYRTTAAGTAKVQAYVQALRSSEVALTGATRSLEAGLGTAAEVLEAQARVFASARELLQARLEYVLARLQLTARAGMPMADVVVDVDRFLVAGSPPRKPLTP